MKEEQLKHKAIKKTDLDIVIKITGEERCGMSYLSFPLAYYKKQI